MRISCFARRATWRASNFQLALIIITLVFFPPTNAMNHSNHVHEVWRCWLETTDCLWNFLISHNRADIFQGAPTKKIHAQKCLHWLRLLWLTLHTYPDATYGVAQLLIAHAWGYIPPFTCVPFTWCMAFNREFLFDRHNSTVSTSSFAFISSNQS